MVPLAEKLAADYEVHILEFSAHGKTPESNGFGIEVFAKEISDYLKQNDFTQAHVFGYSMGGYAALIAAHKDPKSFKSIFTLGTKFLWTSDYADKESTRLDPEKIQMKLPSFAAHLKDRHPITGWEKLLTLTSGMMKNLGRQNQLTADLLQNINIPVCIAVGEEDITVSVEESRSISNLLPNSILVTLANVPHPIEKVPLELLAERIRVFNRLTLIPPNQAAIHHKEG
jgi:pimeloyl-ACP methyl ester carboxylesterase